MAMVTKSENTECSRHLLIPVLQAIIENWRFNDDEDRMQHMRMREIVRNAMPLLAENLDRLCLL
jgi:hypothetical protein